MKALQQSVLLHSERLIWPIVREARHARSLQKHLGALEPSLLRSSLCICIVFKTLFHWIIHFKEVAFAFSKFQTWTSFLALCLYNPIY